MNHLTIRLVILLAVSGCAAQPDDSVYEEGVETKKMVFNAMGITAEGKRLLLRGGIPTVLPEDGGQVNLTPAPHAVKVINLSQETVFYWQSSTYAARATDFDPRGEYLVVSARHWKISAVERHPGALFVVDLVKKKKIFETTVAENFQAVAFSADGKKLLVACYAGQMNHLRLYEFPSMRELARSPSEKSKLIKSVGFFDSGSKVVVCGYAGTVEVLKVPSFEKVDSVEIGENVMGNMRAVRGGKFLIQGQNERFHLLDPEKMMVTSFEAYSTGIGSFDVVPGTDLVLCWGMDRVGMENASDVVFKVWDISKQKLMLQTQKPGLPYGSFVVFPDGKRIAFVEDSRVRIREIADLLPEMRKLLPD